MFKLIEKNNQIKCYIDNILKYIFIRNKVNKFWEAYLLKDNIIINEVVDSDKYRYDLAERLDIKR